MKQSLQTHAASTQKGFFKTAPEIQNYYHSIPVFLRLLTIKKLSFNKLAGDLYLKISFLLLLLINVQNAGGQSVCNTLAGEGAIGAIAGGGGTAQLSSANTDPIYLRVYVHAVAKSDGSHAPTIQEINWAMDALKADFKIHNIYFVRQCDILPANSNALFYSTNPVHIECTLYQYGLHTDGIDIFIGADDAIPYNAAVNIPGTAFIVKGTFTADGALGTGCTAGPQWVHSRSHTISHEMGHCLGLWHTHHGVEDGTMDNCEGQDFDPLQCEELVGVPTMDCGDYVKDTPADPGLAACDGTMANCTYNGNATDSQGHLYHPDMSLIMSYSHNNCQTHHSTGQGERMRDMILMYSPILQACRITIPAAADVSIPTTTEWTTANTANNGDVQMNGNLVIESGATLTIKPGVTVHFGTNNSLIIKPRGKLVLYGTLTSRGCNGYTWQGVTVWGTASTQSQYPVGGVYPQGRIECRSGALIENANTGVQLYGPTADLAGGQISCRDAMIKNCIKGVEFKPYLNFLPIQQTPPPAASYFGVFSGTTFLTDDAYPFSNDFRAFADLDGVSGVIFYGCTFTNAKTGYAIAQSAGYGIYANEAGFSVLSLSGLTSGPTIASKFSGLGNGIYATRMTTNRPYVVREADFTDCFVGIRNNAVAGGTLLFNNFNLGKLPWIDIDEEGGGVTEIDQIGVLFENEVAGFTCEENNFTHVNGQPEVKTIGSICIKTGTQNKKIRRNTYTGLDIGNLANQNNASLDPLDIRGLYYECNQNFNVVSETGIDFSVPDGAIKPEQGLESPSPNGGVTYKAAGNRFSYTGTDIAVFGAGIKYYYDHVTANHVPMVIQGGVITSDVDANTCGQTYCHPPCKTRNELSGIKADYYTKRTSLHTLNTTMGTNPTVQQKATRAYYQQTMDQDAYMVVLHIMYDTIGNTDSLRIWLANMNSVEGDLWLANSYLAANAVQRSNDILDALPAKYNLPAEQQADIANVKIINNAVAGQNTSNLNATALQIITPIADGPDGYARGWARRLLMQHGWYFAPEYIKYGRGSGDRNIRLKNVEKKGALQVQPNPASDFVVFTLPNSTANAVLRIFDVNGRLISVFPDLQGGSSLTWHTDNAASGIYYYQCSSNGTSVTGKILLNK